MKIGSSCAAVTGYDSPKWPISEYPEVKAGRRMAGESQPRNQEPEHFSDPLSFVPPRVRTGATKLLRKKKNEGSAVFTMQFARLSAACEMHVTSIWSPLNHKRPP